MPRALMNVTLWPTRTRSDHGQCIHCRLSPEKKRVAEGAVTQGRSATDGVLFSFWLEERLSSNRLSECLELVTFLTLSKAGCSVGARVDSSLEMVAVA